MKFVFKYLVLFLLVMVSASELFAQGYLIVRNPWTTYSESGSVQNAQVVVKPGPGYFLYNIFIDYSAEGVVIGPETDTLEIEHAFIMPHGTAITDAWLGFPEGFVQAELLDGYTASGEYQGVVQAQLDPLLVEKLGPESYRLKIFPLEPDSIRRIMIEAVVPASPQGARVTLPLLEGLWTSGLETPDSVSFIMLSGDGYENPLIVNYEDLETEEWLVGADTSLRFEVPKEAMMGNAWITYEKSSEPSYDITHFDHLQNFGMYSIDWHPERMFANWESRTWIFGIDIDTNLSQSSEGTLLSTVENFLIQNISRFDSIGFVYTNLSGVVTTPVVPATVGEVSALISSVNQQGADDFESTFSGLFDQSGIGGRNGVMITAAGKVVDDIATNQFVASLSSPGPNRLAILDVTDQNYGYWVDDTEFYFGQQYLYQTLSLDEDVEHEILLFTGKDLFDALEDYTFVPDEVISSPSLQVAITDGGPAKGVVNSYGPSSQNIELEESNVWLGRYIGSGIMRVTFSAFVDGIQQSIVVDHALEDSNVQSDSLLVEAYSTRLLNDLEVDRDNRNDIADALDWSFDERVLSRYTGFLALEPNDSTIFVCEDCDDTQIVSINSGNNASGVFYLFPNPFHGEVTIGWNESVFDLDDLSIIVVDQLGREVAIQLLSLTSSKAVLDLSFLDPGVYLIKVQAGSLSHSFRVLK